MSETHDRVKIGLLSVSDRAAAGTYEDKGIPALQAWLTRALRNPVDWDTRVIPDEEDGIAEALIELVDDSPTPAIRRDDDGIALGGLRLAPVDVPIEALSGEPGPSGELICQLFGSPTNSSATIA